MKNGTVHKKPRVFFGFLCGDSSGRGLREGQLVVPPRRAVCESDTGFLMEALATSLIR